MQFSDNVVITFNESSVIPNKIIWRHKLPKLSKILESLEIRASALMEFMLVMFPVVRKALCMDLALSMIKYLI